jgi:predicted small lipoprotein YifL
MLISKQILVSALIVVSAVTSLTGCGQTGSLYLPAPQIPVKSAIAMQFIAVHAYITGAKRHFSV